MHAYPSRYTSVAPYAYFILIKHYQSCMETRGDTCDQLYGSIGMGITLYEYIIIMVTCIHQKSMCGRSEEPEFGSI